MKQFFFVVGLDCKDTYNSVKRKLSKG